MPYAPPDDAFLRDLLADLNRAVSRIGEPFLLPEGKTQIWTNILRADLISVLRDVQVLLRQKED